MHNFFLCQNHQTTEFIGHDLLIYKVFCSASKIDYQGVLVSDIENFHGAQVISKQDQFAPNCDI